MFMLSHLDLMCCSFPPLRDARVQAVRNVTSAAAESDARSMAGLLPRAQPTDIPPSCLPGPEDDSVAWTRPYGLTCRFDLYGIPNTTVGDAVADNSLWVSGYYNDFANKNMTKVS